MKTFLKSAQQHGEIRLFDRQFARHLTELNGAEVPELLLASALTSYGISKGDTCLLLDSVATSSLYKNPDLRVVRQKVPPVAKWRKVLLEQRVVTTPPESVDTNGVEAEAPLSNTDLQPATPLILDAENRLYLARYWSLEQSLIASVKHYLDDNAPNVDLVRLRVALAKLFTQRKDDDDATDWQKAAVATSVLSNFSVITGGPGTGKTYTVTALLAALLDQGIAPEKIALAAPTGKASTRLMQSIQNNLSTLLEKLNLPQASFEATTLHKLIGMRPGRVKPRFNKQMPLLYDVVIIDEASMIDLPLMARTFEALADNARIVLIGDKDQLHSVESGMVLGDICGGRSRAELSDQRCEELLQLGVDGITATSSASTGLNSIADRIIYLEKSHRVQDEGGISALASAVNKGDVEAALTLLNSEQWPGLSMLPQEPASLEHILCEQVLPAYRKVAAPGSPADALGKMSDTGVLCALRHGPAGALRINARVEMLLNDDGLRDLSAKYYHGQPLMITENSNPQRLYNGDHGLVLSDEHGSLAVHFATEGAEQARAISPNRLPQHETFYAMTIHKSQGSEYSTVIVVLPETDSPILSRELLYTAITRARSRVIVIANEAQLRACIEKRSLRQSGLRHKFWSGTAGSDVAASELAGKSPEEMSLNQDSRTQGNQEPLKPVQVEREPHKQQPQEKQPEKKQLEQPQSDQDPVLQTKDHRRGGKSSTRENKGKPDLPTQTELDF